MGKDTVFGYNVFAEGSFNGVFQFEAFPFTPDAAIYRKDSALSFDQTIPSLLLEKYLDEIIPQLAKEMYGPQTPEDVVEDDPDMEIPWYERERSHYEYRNFRDLYENAGAPTDWLFAVPRLQLLAVSKAFLRQSSWIISCLAGPVGLFIGIGGMFFEQGLAIKELWTDDPADMEEYSTLNEARDIGIDTAIVAVSFIPMGTIASKVVKGVYSGVKTGAKFGGAINAARKGAQLFVHPESAAADVALQVARRTGYQFMRRPTEFVARNLLRAAAPATRAGIKRALRLPANAAEMALPDFLEHFAQRASRVWATSVQNKLIEAMAFLEKHSKFKKLLMNIKGRHVGLTSEDSLYHFIEWTAKLIVKYDAQLAKLALISDKLVKAIEFGEHLVKGAKGKAAGAAAKASAKAGESKLGRAFKYADDVTERLVRIQLEQAIIKAKIAPLKVALWYYSRKAAIYAEKEGVRAAAKADAYAARAAHFQERITFQPATIFKRRAATVSGAEMKRRRMGVMEDIKSAETAAAEPRGPGGRAAGKRAKLRQETEDFITEEAKTTIKPIKPHKLQEFEALPDRIKNAQKAEEKWTYAEWIKRRATRDPWQSEVLQREQTAMRHTAAELKHMYERDVAIFKALSEEDKQFFMITTALKNNAARGEREIGQQLWHIHTKSIQLEKLLHSPLSEAKKQFILLSKLRLDGDIASLYAFMQDIDHQFGEPRSEWESSFLGRTTRKGIGLAAPGVLPLYDAIIN